MGTQARDQLIFALDVPTLDEALGWVERLRGHVGLFKVGLELFSAAGPEAARAVARASGAGVFLDLKLYDIPMTVERAVRAVRRSGGVGMLTVHVAGGRAMLEGAVRAAGGEIALLGVTRVTSLPAEPAEVVRLAREARDAGCAGVVCSGLEVAAVRAATGPALRIVCPGVRMPDAPPDDQARTLTPAEALAAGADYLVVGRPIRDAADPVRAADEIASSLAV